MRTVAEHLFILTLLAGLSPSHSQVKTCFKCKSTGDGSPCAIQDSDSLTSTDCGQSDHDNEFCFVTRDKGKWERGCCQGANVCVDKHKTNEDGSTLDTLHCHENDCNFGNPRTQSDGGQVTECYKCTGQGDDSTCAIGDSSKLQTEKCGQDDWDNEYCMAQRNSGVWSRGCCRGKKNCEEIHEQVTDGGTNDQVNCHDNKCNLMDPRTYNSAPTARINLAAITFITVILGNIV